MSTKYRILDNQQPHFLTLTIIQWADIFSRPVYKDIFMDSLAFCVKNKGLVLHAYVIISNHVHLIASAKEGIKLSAIIRDLKRFTARRLYETLLVEPTESRRYWMRWIFESEGQRSSCNENIRVWTHDNHPIILETNGILEQKLNYLHQNPVKAGICFAAEDYVYSSAANYAGQVGIAEVNLLD